MPGWVRPVNMSPSGNPSGSSPATFTLPLNAMLAPPGAVAAIPRVLHHIGKHEPRLGPLIDGDLPDVQHLLRDVVKRIERAAIEPARPQPSAAAVRLFERQ